ncbi:MAG: tetratricopeptide repeat protein [Anaerovoracaceae bacterium]
MNTLLTQEDIEELESLSEGYFYDILQYIQNFISEGISEGRFNREEAEHDLEIALWVSYACNNIDEYEYYYMAYQWLSDVEDLAQGCGVWYYRYSCALMYCGKLKQALRYAEKGVKEDPEYPWGWLQLAKLRSHFGDKEGALAANESGLCLVPGDYEFLRQKDEIERDCTLEQLLNHYIYEDEDRDLQAGILDNTEKLSAIAGVVVDKDKLRQIKSSLHLTNWAADLPYCSCLFPYEGRMITAVFEMNEAAVSKLDLTWLMDTADSLPELVRLQQKEKGQSLAQIIFYRNQSIELVFGNNGSGAISPALQKKKCI